MISVTIATHSRTGEVRRVVAKASSGSERHYLLTLPGATATKEDMMVVTFPAEPKLLETLSDASARGAVGLVDYSTVSQDWYRAAEERDRVAMQIATHGQGSGLIQAEAFWERMYQYQKTGAVWLDARRRGILGDEPGLGKTLQALVACRYASRVLVVTMPIVRNHWQKISEQWTERGAYVAEGSRSDRAYVIKQSLEFMQRRPGALIVNHEMLRGANSRSDPYGMLYSVPWDAVILDEAHKFQDPQSQQSKGAAKLAKITPRLFLLTGTPVWNTADSIWHLLHLIDPWRWSSYWHFVSEYCDTVPTEWGTKILGMKPAKEDQFRTVLAPLMVRRMWDDVLPDLPDKVVQIIPYSLTALQRKQARILKKELRLIAAGGLTVQWPYAPAQVLTNLRRLCNAPVLVDPALIAQENPKDTALDQLLDTLIQPGDGRKVVIFTWHLDYTDYLVNRLAQRYKVAVCHGGLSLTAREFNISQFRGMEDVQILVATIASVGTGIDLVEASSAIFAEASYVWTENVQAEGRLRRIGQKSRVMIYRLQAAHSVESAIWDTVVTRQDAAETIMAVSDIVDRLLEDDSTED